MDSEQLSNLVQITTGPAPWFWETFPRVTGASGKRFEWRYHGEQGELAYLVTLHLPGEPSKPRLAINTYCRPFLIGAHQFGIWCPEGRRLRFASFDPDTLRAFESVEIVGWFKNSGERIYSATEPLAEFELDTVLQPGTHPIEVPAEFRKVDELLVPTSYKALSKDDPALAIFVVYLQAGLVEVLPQSWITANTHDIGNNWITRVARDPDTHRIVGEMSRVGFFELANNGRDFSRWL